VKDVLRQYGRYFIGPVLGDRFADGLLALEKNWEGPVLENTGIDETLKHFQAMERDAGPREKLKWRYQQALYRAYYDAFVRARLRHETAALDAALAKLREAKTAGVAKATADAEAILDLAAKQPAAPELRARLDVLAEALFQSIRAQLSFAKYHGMPGRGNTLDTADVPLTDAAWWRTRNDRGEETPRRGAARLARLDAALNRTDPGPGGVSTMTSATRSANLTSSATRAGRRIRASTSRRKCAFGTRGFAIPRAWWHHAETHYETPPPREVRRPRPEGFLSRAGGVRRSGGAEGPAHGRGRTRGSCAAGEVVRPSRVRHPEGSHGRRQVNAHWTPEAGAGGPGRGCQVCEVWVLKKP